MFIGDKMVPLWSVLHLLPYRLKELTTTIC